MKTQTHWGSIPEKEEINSPTKRVSRKVSHPWVGSVEEIGEEISKQEPGDQEVEFK